LGQSRFWFLRLLVEDQTTFNVTFYYRMTGNLRVGDLERAVRVVTARHEALRTCFIGDENEADQASQSILASSPIKLERRRINSVEEVEAEYTRLQAHEFDLASGNLLRLVLLTLSPSSHYLLVNYHHIIMDGVSFRSLSPTLKRSTTAKLSGRRPSSTLISRWLNGKPLRKGK
jgi:hybrid polyketide synthase/nonribosomal peptide synthetase ACE1